MSNTVYVISGGNRGIGLAVVKELTNRPNSVVITTARNPEKATELQSWIKEHPNVHVVKYDADVLSDAADLAKEVDKISSDGIDILFANSGAGETLGSVIDSPAENFTSLYNTNVLGPIFLFKSLYPALLKRNTRKVLFTSSALGSKGAYTPVSSNAYGQSKAALNYTAKELSHELDDKDFIIVPFHPGLVSSDLGNSLIATVAKHDAALAKHLESTALTTEQSASHIVKLAEGLTKEDNGKFYNYDKTTIPW